MTNLPKTGVELVAENASGFLSALNRASGGVNTFENNTKRAGVGAIALGTTLGNLAAGALTQIARLATQAGTALASFVGDSVSMAADLEAQMSGVAAVMGASSEELETLNDLIIDLGLDPNLTVSTLEAAEAMEVLAKAGINYTEINDGALESTIALANATGSDFAVAAGIAVSGMSLFNIEAANMQDVVNGTSAVVNSSTFDVNDFALALTNGGAVANSMGIEFDEFATTIAAISPQFSSGQTAGTAFKNLLLRLVPATDKAEDAMKELGLITADGANIFFDAEGNIKDMSAVAGILSNTLADLSIEQQTSALKTIFGNDAMGAAIALAQIGEGEFSALADSMAQVDAGAAAAIRVNNFAGALDIAGGAVEAIKLQIGAFFLPVLTQLARKFSEFAEENGPKFIGFFETAATFVGTFVDNLLAGSTVFGSFLGALGSIGVSVETLNKMRDTFIQVGEAFQRLGQFVAEHKDAIIGAIKGIGIVLAGAAIAAAIAAIASAIALILSPLGLLIIGAGLLGAAWESNFMNIQETTSNALGIITFGLGEVWITLQRIRFILDNAFVPSFRMAAQVLGFVVFRALTKTSEAVTTLANNFGTVMLQAAGIATFAILKASERMGIAINSLLGIFTIALELMTNVAISFSVVWVEKINSAIDIWHRFTGAIGAAMGGIKADFNAVKNAVQGLIDTLSNLSVPALFTPGSPTPLEIGLRGIASAAVGAADGIGAITAAWDRAGQATAQVFDRITTLPNTAELDQQLATIEERIASISGGTSGLSGRDALQAIYALTAQRDQLATPQQIQQNSQVNNTTNNNQQQNTFNLPDIGLGLPTLLEEIMALNAP